VRPVNESIIEASVVGGSLLGIYRQKLLVPRQTVSHSYVILSPMERQELIKKIEELPPDRLAEVENFVESLARRDLDSQKSLHQAIGVYAIQHAGTPADLDSDLEAAAVEHLLQETS
jgi:hypothetical protein